jgi:hypothetical protein
MARSQLIAPPLTRTWKSQALRAYQRRTLAADALIASTYLAGTNTRRVRRALAALFGGAVGATQPFEPHWLIVPGASAWKLERFVAIHIRDSFIAYQTTCTQYRAS